MKRFVVVVLLAFYGLLAAAQGTSKLPVPLWPGSEAEAMRLYKGQNVFVNQNGSELIVLLGGEQATIARIPLHNQIHPTVHVKLSGSSGNYTYQYAISNGTVAKDSIGTWSIVIPREQFRVTMTHPGGSDNSWVGAPASAAVAQQTELGPGFPAGRYALWTAENTHARIQPGASLAGFGIQSDYIPGFTSGFLSSGDLLNLPQGWPDEVFKQLRFLEDRSKREVPVLTIGPMFPEATSGEQIGSNVKLGIRRWAEAGLVDTNAPFIQALLNALGNKNAGRGAQINQRPQTPYEEMIAQVVQISLHLEITF